MKKKKNKKIIIGVILISLMTLSLLYFVLLGPRQQTSYFYDKELGIVKTQITIYDWWNKFMRIFQQTIVFAKTSAEIGETISLTDTHNVVITDTTSSTLTQCYMSEVSLAIKQPSGSKSYIKYRVLSPAVGSFSTVVTTSSFSPTSAGTWSGESEYREAECSVLPAGTNCMSSTYCLNVNTEQSSNSVSVTAPVCDKNPYCDSWTLDHTISNGEVTKRTCYDVDSSCNYNVDYIDYKTTCNDGFYIEGTTNSFADGVWSCLAPSSSGDCTVDGCELNQICDVNTKVCVDSECNDGDSFSEVCPDNVTIIKTKECVNGRFEDTNNVCPSTQVECNSGDEKCESNIYYLCVNNYWESQGKVDGKCGYSSSTQNNTQQSNNTTAGNGSTTQTNDSSSTTTPIYQSSGINWVIILIVVGVVVGVVIFIIVLARRR